MEEKEAKETNVKATIDAVTGLVKSVPIYQDAVQPAAKQLGQSIETVTKAVNIALAPIKALVWGYEKIEEFITTRVAEKLKNVPKENIVTPPTYVAGPAVEALRYAGHDSNLRELYANLLATSMDNNTVQNAHPSFVEIIKNLSSDEARLLQAFSKEKNYPIVDIKVKFNDETKGYTILFKNHSHLNKIISVQKTDLLPSYLDNLCRLGILEIPSGVYLIAPNTYEPIEQEGVWKSVNEKLEGKKITFDRKVITTTEFGNLFIRSVVDEKS